jgi:hypothetical protein
MRALAKMSHVAIMGERDDSLCRDAKEANGSAATNEQ